ncbi:type II secretion system F family protein [Bacillus suaedaesalsae]|uniref:Type II secretion system F family protein n=1 Tax=Bacillus suaedaesalsae TaxID=2810349 RepID=A0ABS2DMW8_9BACI|nr:type II secretion system F family protein [Bacillus suaedaesalsae]MBM6619756.1 type II secretion system F family protein [Bacillus suaedaesalsae]
MPIFKYEGRDKRGIKVSGKIQGETKREATTILREKGIAVIHINELTGILYREIKFGQEKIKLRDFVVYVRQFSTLLKAGIPLVEATNILHEQTSNKILKRVLHHVEEGLRAGIPYTDAAEKYRKVFPPLFINMMRAGEAGGNLDEILDRLADYYEKQNRTRQKVKSAMTYPLVVGSISIVIVIFLLAVVVPTFVNMFASFGAELPAITRFVLWLSSFFTHFWWLLLLVGIAIYVGLTIVLNNKELRYYFDYFLLKLPIFGKLLQKAALARLTRTLSSLFASAVPILQSVSIVEKIVGNEVISRVIRQSRLSLEQGRPLAEPMKGHWVFPPMVSQMISVGETTGSLDVMLDKVADYYEAEVEATTDQIKSLIEPMMIVLLAFVVGSIVASIAVPMFTIFEKIG